MRPVTRVVIGLIRAYQLLVSPFLAPSCRFHPTCSSYACEAVHGHGLLAGGWLTVRRLARCHPWGGMGFDPVPERGAEARPAAVHGHGPGNRHIALSGLEARSGEKILEHADC